MAEEVKNVKRVRIFVTIRKADRGAQRLVVAGKVVGKVTGKVTKKVADKVAKKC